MASATKALLLLEAASSGKHGRTLTDLARQAGLPKSTALRLLSRLQDTGFIARIANEYFPSHRLFELGNAVDLMSQNGLRETAAPYLSALFVHTRMVVHLAVLDAADVLYLDKIRDNSASVAPPTHIGARLRAGTTGLGKAMLAFAKPGQLRSALEQGLSKRTPMTLTNKDALMTELGRIRTTGIAFDRDETVVGLSCVAVPLLLAGAPVGAISVSGPSATFDQTAHIAPLRRVAGAIVQELGSHPRRGDETA